MIDKTAKVVLRTLVTIGNLPLLVVPFVFFLADRFADEGGAQVFGLVMLVLGVGNVAIVWRWRAQPGNPFDITYRFYRGFLWTLNLLVFLLLGFVAGGNLKLLWLALPCGLGLLGLVFTRRAYADGGIQTTEQVAAVAPVLSDDDYYAQRKAEMDQLQQETVRILIDKYGFQPEFVQRGLSITPLDNRAARVGQGERLTAEVAAERVFNLFYHSREANNPEVFARHVETGEPLPPDFNHRDWRDVYLGRGSDQKIISLMAIIFGAGLIYGIFADSFFPSAVWFQASVLPTLMLMCMLGINFRKRWLQGRVRAQPGRRAPRKLDMLWAVPFGFVLLWFTLYAGMGSIGNAAIGQPVRTEYAYKKAGNGKPCLRITNAEAFSFAQFCVSRSNFQTLPEEGTLGFTARRAWFGTSLSEYHMPFSGR